MFILCSDVTKGLKLSVVVEQVIPSYALVDVCLISGMLVHLLGSHTALLPSPF